MISWKWLDRAEEWFLAATMAGVVVINFVNIAARYLFSASIAPSEEIMIYAFVGMSFVGVVVAIRRRSNLGLSLLTDALPPRWRRAVSCLGSLVGVVFFATLLYWGSRMVWDEFRYRQTTPALGLPEWIFGLLLPGAALLALLRTVQVGLAEWQGGQG